MEKWFNYFILFKLGWHHQLALHEVRIPFPTHTFIAPRGDCCGGRTGPVYEGGLEMVGWFLAKPFGTIVANYFHSLKPTAIAPARKLPSHPFSGAKMLVSGNGTNWDDPSSQVFSSSDRVLFGTTPVARPRKNPTKHVLLGKNMSGTMRSLQSYGKWWYLWDELIEESLEVHNFAPFFW